MLTNVTENPGKSRAAFIRALVAAGVSKNKLIRQHCLEAGFPEPGPEAIKRARDYVPKGPVPPSRPTYRGCCEAMLSAYQRALGKGLPVIITADMKDTLIVMEHCLSTDTRIEKRKVYKRKQKRKKLRERKLKPPAETP
jgi:hypothetical protein